jgi:ATP/maltotriose-dependent transcriptional regulator MalT
MRAAEVPSFYVRLLLATAWCEVDVCRLGRAQECVDELGATLRKGEHLDLRLQADLVWGRILLESGQLDEAAARLAAVRDRARVAGLGVVAESAHALMGQVSWLAGDHRAAKDAFKQSIAQLEKAHDLAALADACVSRARVMAEVEDPNRIFAPILEMLDGQPVPTLKLEYLLAVVRWLRARGEPTRFTLEEATGVLDRMIRELNDTDQAALRLHPWSREIRLAGKL